ncbi:NAD kinase [Haloechinothrix sp. YIM 98757]|uniref:NAD kinase n=1 Tax=Haloechinothrix aidingensis TaxID=2752311 RepID=A0A838AFV3_9PSEU|nr:NAD kinase [Haloechinothrix aidingensis]MBA0128264.1 NAD kinase [Haloechinothrix aidingensis]
MTERDTASREVLLVANPDRPGSRAAVREVGELFVAAGFRLRVLNAEVGAFLVGEPDAGGGAMPYTLVAPEDDPAAGVELVFVFGGDGTLLGAAEVARQARVPVLGVNLGRMGFLAEADSDALAETVQRIVAGSYSIEERMTVDVTVALGDETLARTWALNEASVEKSSRELILDALISIDGRPVSSFGCDGVLCATPTGSTAYAFSAGGPIIWPDVEALLVVPSNAHAMFSRPMVVSRDSVITVDTDPSGSPGVLTCDGSRHVDLPSGARIEVAAGGIPVSLVRLWDGPFTDRLVYKFDLPVKSWRERHPRTDRP